MYKFIDHTDVNFVLLSLTTYFAVATAASSGKDAIELQKSADAGIALPEEAKNIIILFRTSIAMSVFSAILLVIVLAMHNTNNKLFKMVKTILCVAILITGLMVLVYGSQLTNLPSNKPYGKYGIAAGVLSIFAVGSCVLHLFKSL